MTTSDNLKNQLDRLYQRISDSKSKILNNLVAKTEGVKPNLNRPEMPPNANNNNHYQKRISSQSFNAKDKRKIDTSRPAPPVVKKLQCFSSAPVEAVSSIVPSKQSVKKKEAVAAAAAANLNKHKRMKPNANHFASHNMKFVNSPPKSNCLYFTRHGYCKSGDNCKYAHNKATIALCQKVLQNGACTNDKCQLEHILTWVRC